MKRDFGYRFVNLFDTMIASQFLGLPRIGLADLIRHWFGHVIDKKYQRHDWAARPLEDEHLEYARGDTHFLPALREVLTGKLRRANKLVPVMEECRKMELREWQGRVHDPADFLRVKGARQLDEPSQRVLRALYAWRDREAASADRPAFKVVPDPVLLEIATAKPKTPQEVTAMMRKGSGLARRFGAGLAEAVVAGIEDPEPLPTPAAREQRQRPVEGLRGRDAERLLNRLKDWRNEIVTRDNVAPITVAANGILREITRLAPRSLEELSKVPEIREWQIEQHGDAIVALVLEVVGERTPPGEEMAPAAKKRRRRRGRRPNGDAATAGAPEAVPVEEASAAASEG
jgi:ribonuclease D